MAETLAALVGLPPPLYFGALRPFYMVGRPGFFGGFGGWVDLFSPLMWNYGMVPSQCDYDTALIALDWNFVGTDMQAAIGREAEAIAA
jgi:hypothetical protein